jgi:predicted phage tail protein
MAERREDRSLGELFADLASETSTLVRQELRLAATETSQRVTSAGKDVGVLVAGGVLIHVAFLALVAAIILALGELGLPWWLSALIVALVLAGVGAALVGRARTALKRADILPRHAINTMREDQEWVKEQVS